MQQVLNSSHYHQAVLASKIRSANKIARVAKRIDRYSPVFEDGASVEGAKLTRILARSVVRVLNDKSF